MATIYPLRLEAIKDLYYQKKLSVPEIAKELGVSVGAVYSFMARNNLVRRNLSENNAVRFAAKKPSFSPITSFNPQQQELKTVATALYWAEGFKSKATFVDFANSDPAMIKVFVRFLREICRIDETKLRGYLYCYSNQDIASLISFWSHTTGIPKDQFSKPYVRYDFDSNKQGKMGYGLFHVRYCDKKLVNLLLQWIVELSLSGA